MPSGSSCGRVSEMDGCYGIRPVAYNRFEALSAVLAIDGVGSCRLMEVCHREELVSSSSRDVRNLRISWRMGNALSSRT